MSFTKEFNVLPFLTLCEERLDPLPEESEHAAIFCLAELDRFKGGGFVRKQLPEQLAFISKIGYPFWAVPFGNRTLLFDGLNTISNTLHYLKLPDIQSFSDNIRISSRTSEAYHHYLSDNLNFFTVGDEETTKEIGGLILEKEILGIFIEYLSNTPQDLVISSMVQVTPSLDDASVAAIINELQKLKLTFQKNITLLYEVMKFINKKTERFVRSLNNDIGITKDTFEKKIENLNLKIKEKIAQIQRDSDLKITNTTQKTDELLFRVQQEKIKLEKTNEHIIAELEHWDAKKKNYTINKDDLGVQRSNKEKAGLKNRFSKTEKKIKEVNKEITILKDKQKIQLFKLKSDCDSKITTVRKTVFDVESTRDARIHLFTEKIEALENVSHIVITQIDKITKLGEAFLTEFDTLGINLEKKKILITLYSFLFK